MKKKLIVTLFAFLTLLFSCASVETKQTEPIHPEEPEMQMDDIIEDKKPEEPTQISVNNEESQNAETSDYEQPSEAASSLEKELEPEEPVKEQQAEEKKEPAEPEHNTEKEEVKKSTEAEKKTEASVQPAEQSPKPEEKISTPEPEKQSHKEPEKKIEENKTESPKDKEEPADEEKTVEEQPVETKEEAQNKEDSSLEKQSESVSSEGEEPPHEIPEKQAETELPINKEPEKKAENPQSMQPPAETKEKKQQPPQFFSEFPDTEPEKEDKPVISKNLEVAKGQRLELSYPGEQWVYLGESTSKNGIKYIQRKLHNKQSVFTFLSETEGDYILNFSYFDAFSGDFVSDSVMVKVEQPKDGRSVQSVAEHKMPEPKTVQEAKEEIAGNNAPDTEKHILTETFENKITEKQPSYTNPVKEAEPANSSSSSIVEEEPDVLISSSKTAGKKAGKRSISIEDAKEALASGNGSEALKILTDFLQANSEREDEAWFLKGQVYELNGDTKNIKLALEAYKFLVKAFPQSNHWNEADARIRYIKKFYINIK